MATINGTAAADEIYGESAGDTISGLQGNDTLHGGPETGSSITSGPDIIYGNQGEDILYGADNDDTIYGGQDNDLIYGEDGSDVLYGNLLRDDIYGGSGQDTVFGGQDNDDIYGEDGQDVLYGNANEDNMYGGDGNDTLWGGQHNDALDGDSGNDVLYGQLDNDTLDFNNDGDSDGNDTFYGGQGNDCLDGTGEGNSDQMWGNLGRDSFDYRSYEAEGSTDATMDRLMDFQTGTDKVLADTNDDDDEYTEVAAPGVTSVDEAIQFADQPDIVQPSPLLTGFEYVFIAGAVHGYLIVNVDGNSDFEEGTDYVIVIQNANDIADFGSGDILNNV
jgi:Ca2+-binding RTX toxin-like protein